MNLYIFLIVVSLIKGCSSQVFAGIILEKTVSQFLSTVNYVLNREGLDIPISHEVQFNLYTKKNPQVPQVLPHVYPSILHMSNFNSSLKTFFIIHGFTDNKDRESIANLRIEINKSENANVIVVDWERLAGLVYFTAASNTLPVGKFVGQFLLYLEKNYVDLKTVHLIGHSLGAHISGIAGAVVGGRVGRITGLDPAGPLFEFIDFRDSSESLDESDAIFVDIIHTDAEEFGTKLPHGHADFYPNGGMSPQPGCNHLLAVSCSHVRSIEFYMESISGQIPFEARHCNMAEEGVKCLEETPVHMGHHLSTMARGVFYVETNAEPPFAKQNIFC